MRPPREPTITEGSDRPTPEQIAGYKVLDVIADGRQSQLFRCLGKVPGLEVCLKLLLVNEKENAQTAAHFLASAEALKGHAHDNIVAIHEVGKVHGRPYVIMDYVPGQSLARILFRGALRMEMALRSVGHAAAALKFARSVGLHHGDVRPGHLLMSQGVVQLIGFGLTPPFRTAHGRELRGDPAYTAPEIVQGDDPDHRADIYSLGCTFYELLVGRPPFGTGSPDALAACHVLEPLPSITKQVPLLPDGVEVLCRQMCAKDPQDRPASFDTIIEAVSKLAPDVAAATPRGPVVVIEVGATPGLATEIPEGELLLGRMPDEGIYLDDGRISRRHAVLRRQGHRVTIADLGSRNGIRVNGERTHGARLTSGDRITLGDTVIRVDNLTPITGQYTGPSTSLIPSSPLRGAFGAREVSHAPANQAGPQVLAERTGDAVADQVRVAVLGQLSTLLAGTSGGVVQLRREVIALLKTQLLADDGIVIRVEGDSPLLEAQNAQQAELLSVVMPAVERALPGHLALSTTLQIGRDGAAGALLAPVLSPSGPVAFVVLISRAGTFTEDALVVLEATCGLLSKREQAR